MMFVRMKPVGRIILIAGESQEEGQGENNAELSVMRFIRERLPR